MSLDSKISIRNLYKVFGPSPERMIGHLRDGIGKDELLAEHGHVLGLRDVNLEIPSARVFVIMGLSGSGKSTLIRHINRLIEPTSGAILVEGHDVLAFNDSALRQFRRRTVSMVFQSFGLLPHRSIAANVGYGLQICGMSKSEIEATTTKWLDRVGLTGFEDRFPSELSGGMRQRVGLARALATDADILLMDEAFSALDPLIRADMQNILLGLQKDLQKTIVFITHDLDEALRIGDRIAILKDGTVVQVGTAEDIVLLPANQYIADFTQDINRAKVLNIATFVRFSEKVDGPTLSQDTSIEDALIAMASVDASAANVMDGKVLSGSVCMHDLIRALKPPKTNRAATTPSVVH